MPIPVTSEVAASADEIARAVEEAAALVIESLAFRPGDRVRVRPGAILVPGLTLVSDLGIVTGYLPTLGGRLSAMFALASGLEQEIDLAAGAVEKVA